jgi:hypothetical protein
MKGETMIKESVLLKDYVDARLEDIILMLQQRINGIEKSIIRSDVVLNDRFASVNEFRSALSDQTRTFISRTEYSLMSDRIDKIEARINTSEGKSSGINAGWGYLVGAIGVVIAVVTTLF